MSSSEPPCPLCGRALTEARALQVCGECHHDLQVGAAPDALRTTAEFAAMVPPADIGIAIPVAPAASAGTVRCSWCGSDQAAARKLLSRGDAHICNQCVALCADILAAELGDDWRR